MVEAVVLMADLTDAVDNADLRGSLQALASQLARDLETAAVNMRPQIAGQLRATLKDLAELPVAGEVSSIDELASRRKDRRSTSAVQGRAAGG